MRTFYIFNISNYLALLTKDCPYNLFKTLEGVYYLDKTNINIGLDLFDQIVIPFHKDDINKLLFNTYKDNDYYMSRGSKHRIYNKYSDEVTEINVGYAFIIIKTNSLKKNIFQNVLINKNLFACDFKNKDYFWLDKIISYN